MGNPFPSHFDSACNSCGDMIFEGDDCFAVDGQFVCESCAEANGNVCPECGEFKQEQFEVCYKCNEEMKDDNEKEYE